ncbi:MAG: hypothetical protein ACREU7_03025 [Burkholderiales bacterium]
MARAAGVDPDTKAWFSRVGLPVSEADRDAALNYLAALGLPGLEIVQAADAAQAEKIIRDPNWDTRWWSREEAERKRLTDFASRTHGLGAALEALTLATEGHTEASFRQAMASAAIVPGGETLARAAAGALLMAVHARALAQLAGCEESHLFMRKYALFSLGRWPLGVAHAALHLF